MNWTTFAESEACYRLSLTLLHSLWLVPALAVGAWILERLSQRRASQLGPLLYTGAIAASLLLMPVTWMLNRGEFPDAASAGTVSLNVAQPLSVPASAQSSQIDPATAQPESQPISSPSGLTAPDINTSSQNVADHAFVQPSLLRASGPWLLAGYACGLLMILLRLVLDVVRNHRLRRQSCAVPAGPIQDAMISLQRSFSLDVLPLVRTIDQTIVPHVSGLVRPVVLIPTSIITGLPTDQLQLILAHELAHIVRRDPWVLLLQRVAETVLFFNPAVWIISRRLNVLREQCCDDQVCRLLPTSNEDPGIRYARALLHVAELTVASSRDAAQLATLAAVSDSPSELRRRIARLLGEPNMAPRPVSRLGLVTIIATVVLLAGLARSSTATVARTPSDDQAAAPTETDTDEAASTSENAEATVEVVAIGTCGATDHWWDARGQVLEKVPFEMSKLPQAIQEADAESWRRIVVRVDNVPEDGQIKWRIEGSNTWGGTAKSTDDLPKSSRLLAKWFSTEEASQAINMKVGLADGSWKTIANSDTASPSAQGSQQHSVVFSPAFAQGDNTTVVVSHNIFDENFRVVAVDRSREVHEMMGRGGLSAGQVYQVTARFQNLKPAQIEQISFQVRPFTWTEFNDIPTDALPAVGADAKDPQRQEQSIVVARHVLLWNGDEIVTWEEVEKRLISAGPRAHPAFYITHGAFESERWESLSKRFWELRKAHKLKGHSEGSLAVRTSFRYDNIRNVVDLDNSQEPEIAGRIKDSRGNSVPSADVVLVTPIDESIPYRGYELAIVRGRVRNPIDHVMVRSNDTGHFSINTEQQSFWLLVMHPDSGFRMIQAASWKNGQDIQLMPWGRLTTDVDEVPGEVQTVNLTSSIEEQDGLPQINITQYWSDLVDHDAQVPEKFLHSYVPPIIRASAGRSFRGTQGSSTVVSGATVSLMPGEQREIDLGPLSAEQKAQIEFMRKQFQSQ